MEIPTAEQWINQQFGKQIIGEDIYASKQGIIDDMILFTQLHVQAALEVAQNNIGLIKTTSEELNSKEYQPFITDEEGNLWTINSILNAYPLTNIK